MATAIDQHEHEWSFYAWNLDDITDVTVECWCGAVMPEDSDELIRRLVTWPELYALIERAYKQRDCCFFKTPEGHVPDCEYGALLRRVSHDDT